MSISPPTWALWAREYTGAMTLWLFRDQYRYKTLPLDYPLIDGSDNSSAAGSPWYQLADLGEGRIGLLWWSMLAGVHSLNLLPLQIDGDFLVASEIVSVQTNITTSTPHLLILDDFVVTLDPNATTGNHTYQVWNKSDLTHVRDGNADADCAEAVGGWMSCVHNTVYFNNSGLTYGIGLKFVSDGSFTRFVMVAPSGGWNTGATSGISAAVAARSYALLFNNTAWDGGGNSWISPRSDYALFRGAIYTNTGSTPTSLRTIQVLDDAGNWAIVHVPYQGDGASSATSGSPIAGGMFSDVLKFQYDEASGSPSFVNSSFSMEMDIPDFTGAVDLGNATVEAGPSTHNYSTDGNQFTAGGVSQQYGNISPWLAQRSQGDPDEIYRVLLWHGALSPWDYTSYQDTGLLVDQTSDPLTFATFAPLLPTRSNAHHGQGVAKITYSALEGSLALDTDGVPYLTTEAGVSGADVQYDTDSVPYIATDVETEDIGFDTDDVPYVRI